MKKNLITLTIAAIVVLAVLIANIVVSSYSSQQQGKMLNNTAYDNVRVSQNFIEKLHSIATNYSLMEKIGNGTANPQGFLNGSGITLQEQGKPEVLTISADYCPYCAITRWSMIIALMRFGNFTLLHYMTSSASDVWPHTPTFTFYNSSYKSAFINFTGLELANNVANPITNSYSTLDKLNANQIAILKKYDPEEGIPFTDFGNYSILLGALGDPSVIQFLNWTTIVQELQNPNSTVAKEIIGAANIFTKKICVMINNEAEVCQKLS
ncbi:MAG: DUF929 family protein [Candidatus Micrarchaeaceae archaeon]